MGVSETFGIARQGLATNRLRTALTTLGILIGVAAVILLVAVGNGSQATVKKRIEGLGTNTLTISRQVGGFGRGNTQTLTRPNNLTAADVTALQDSGNNPDIKLVAPVVNASNVTGSFNGVSYSPSQFIGTTQPWFEIRNYSVASGSEIPQSNVDNKDRVIVIGQTVAANLFGNTNPIDQQVRFGSAQWTVIGILNAKGSNGAQDQDDIVVAPVSSVQEQLTGLNNGYSQIVAQAKSETAMDSAASEVTETLLSTHRITNNQADFQILNQATLLQTSSATTEVFTVLLGAVAAISLLVGGIGVMNIMLVTVTERTREIGIRKAIGAKRSAILGQFLTESVMLSLTGGLLGIATGIGGSYFTIAGLQPVVSVSSVVMAFGVSVAIGVCFGSYPANRAASLSPIEALRYE